MDLRPELLKMLNIPKFHFSNYGQVKHVRITNRGHQGGSQSAGFGFVTYHKESEARNALNNDGGIYFKNMALNVEEKKTRVSLS